MENECEIREFICGVKKRDAELTKKLDLKGIQEEIKDLKELYAKGRND
jgi:hypothetical protein